MTNEELIIINKSIFGDITMIAPDLFYYTDQNDGLIHVVSLDGSYNTEYDPKNFTLYGSFLIDKRSSGLNGNGITINSLTTRNKITTSKWLYDFALVGNEFLLAMSHSNIFIYNSNLDLLGKLDNSELISKTDKSFDYRYSYRKTYTVHLDIASKSIKEFARYNINDVYTAIATEQAKDNKGFSFNKDVPYNFRYKLAKNNRYLTNKSYASITNIQGTSNYFLVADVDNLFDIMYKGLIDADGNEVLKPEFSDIQYLGNEVFSLVCGRKKAIYDAKNNKYIFGLGEVKNVIYHDSLPLSIIETYKSEFFVLEHFGKLYSYNDITKNIAFFKSDDYPTVYKVVYNEYYTCYVNQNLVTIKNLELKKGLLKATWVRI